MRPCLSQGCWLYALCVGACEVTCSAIATPGDVIDLDGLRELGVEVAN